MENSTRKSSSNNGGIEENIMAILDSTGIKDARDVNDDRLAFLEAVRSAFLVAENGIVPSCKLFEAIFQILKDSISLELVMMSYKLLMELDKRFHRVNSLDSETLDSSRKRTTELVVAEEGWSPFSLGLAGVYCETEIINRNSSSLLDSVDFLHLIEKIAQGFDEVTCQVPGMKLVRFMKLFQYLVNFLERDFVARSTVYKETENWSIIRESILNMLLGSKKISYKGFMKDCVSMVSNECSHHADDTPNTSKNADKSTGETVNIVSVGLWTSHFELRKGTYMAMQNLLSVIMELDIIRKQAEIQGQTSRADGTRTPLVEVILDELAYDEELFSKFLDVFSDPKWKLEIILQYFSKYLTKPAMQTRRSNSVSDDATLDSVLSCFSSDKSTKIIIKKISTDAAQLLLAHAFKAYLNLEHHNEIIAGSSDNLRGLSLLQICKAIIAAFNNLRIADKRMEIIPIGKEALFTAATLVSMKS